MNTTTSTTDQMDRSTRLLVCGILAVLGGVLCLALVPLVIFATMMAPQEVHRSSVGMAAGVYGMLGVLAVLLGIGSIRCRRWARDIILAGSHFWLAIGIPGFVFSLWLATKSMVAGMESAGAEVSSSVITTIVVVTGLIYLVLFILMPLVLILLYRGEPVLQTCNRRSGSEGWTTHLSLPQLSCVLICLLIFLNTLFLPVFMPAVMFWDQVLTGTPAILILILFTGLMGYATWGLYFKVAAGWWVGIFGLVLITLNYGIAFYVGDMAEFYRALEFPDEQVQVIQQSGMMDLMKHMWVSMLFYLAIVIAFFWKARVPARDAAA